MKRLGDVVVGACAQPLDLVLPAVARREYQHAVGLAARAQLAYQVKTRQLGQPKVDDGDINWIFGGRIQPFFPVSGQIDAVTGRRQIGFQHLADRRLVFDHQHAHSRPPNIVAQGTSAPLRASTRTIHTLPALDSSRNTYSRRPSWSAISVRTTRAP